MPRAKEDFKERTDKATSIKASVEKTFNDVCEANDVLQVKSFNYDVASFYL